jgi:hypothetical protein
LAPVKIPLNSPLFNPDFAVEIVMRVESPIKTGIPARFFFESVAIPTLRRKIEEMLTNADLAVPVFAGISARNRFSIAKSGFKLFISDLHGEAPQSVVFLKNFQKKSGRLNPVQHCLMHESGKLCGHLFSKKSKKYFGMNASTPIFAIRF